MNLKGVGRSELLRQLSQGHLNCLAACPRKFQHLYLDRLGLPQVEAPQAQQLLGRQFHQLMQQRILGLEIGPLVQTDPHLERWLNAFEHWPPPMIGGDRESEHQRTLLQQGSVLVAVYDLLIQGEQQAQILDWKTYGRPRDLEALRQNWQTRLYLYLLAETSAYPPEQIVMTYWFAEGNPDRPAADRFLTIPYDQACHQQTQQDLTHLLDQLNQWFMDNERGQDFPQVPLTAGQCYSTQMRCDFVGHCQRQQSQAAVLEAVAALGEIEAIAELPL